MNIPSRKSNSVDWKKILVIAVVLGIAGYRYFAQPAPQPDREVASKTSQEEEGRQSEDDAARYDARLPDSTDALHGTRDADNSLELESKKSAAPESPTAKSPLLKAGRADPKSYLVSIGKNQFQSPAGLIYGMAGGGEHRIDHVMRHATDDTSRPSHGVFDGDQETILKLLDEVYEMVKQKSKYVKTEESQGNTAYTISLGRKIGYEGGQKGKRDGNRGLRSVRLVLDGNKVITAYPYR